MKPGTLTRRLLLIPTLLILITVIIQSCDPIRDFIDDLKKEDPVDTKVIGSAGGNIDFEGIILNIPEGAFSGDNEISIVILNGNPDFGEYAASSLYHISGLPETSAKPIKLKIEYNGTLKGDPIVASGIMKYAVSLDSTLISYRANSAQDSSGFLIYEIPPYSRPIEPQQLKSGLPTDVMSFIALSSFKIVTTPAGHFELCYPMLFEKGGTLMGEYFEMAYDTCAKMGFSYKYSKKEYDWPIKVIALPMNSNTSGSYSWQGDKTMSDAQLRDWIPLGDFQINLDNFNNNVELKATCGHEFLHFVQNIYEFSSDYIEPEQDWLAEATAVWIEDKYSKDPNYYSSSFKGLEKTPLEGLQFEGVGYSDRGYGLAFLLKEIVEVYNEKSIVEIHEKIKEGTLPGSPVDPVDAVISVISEPLENLWFRALKKYLTGHYYNNQANTKLTDNIKANHEGMIMDHDFPSENFKYTYHDLSGNLYWISEGNLGSNKIPVSFVVDDPANCGILVCKYKIGGDIIPLGEVLPGGTGQIILDDIKVGFMDGYEIVILVTNGSHDKSINYQGTNEVNLTVGKVSGLTAGKIEFFLDHAVFKRDDATSTYTADLSEVLHLRNLTGTSDFSKNYSYTSLGRKFSGYVTISFIDNPQMMNIRVNHKMSFQGNFGFGERKFEYNMDCYDIPYESYDATSGMFIYSETGSSVSKINVTWSEKNDLYTNELKSYSCGASSFIRVAVDSR